MATNPLQAIKFNTTPPPSPPPAVTPANPLQAIKFGQPGLPALTDTTDTQSSNPSNPLASIKFPGEKAVPEAMPFVDMPWYHRAWKWLWHPIYNFNPNGDEGFLGGVEDLLTNVTTPGNLILTGITFGDSLIGEAAAAGLRLNDAAKIAGSLPNMGETAGNITERFLPNFLEKAGKSPEKIKTALKTVKLVAAGGLAVPTVIATAISSGEMFQAIEDGDIDKAKSLAVKAAAGLGASILATRELSKAIEGVWPIVKPGLPVESENVMEPVAGIHDADLAIAEERAEKLNQHLRHQADMASEGDERDKKTVLGAMFFRREHPEQEEIEKIVALVSASDKVSPEIKEMYKTAASLTPREVDFVRQELGPAFDANYNEAEGGGIALNFLQDYVSHIWKPTEGEDELLAPFRENTHLGNFTTKLASAKNRVWNKAFEGLMKGRELASTDPIQLAAWQRYQIGKVLAHRKALEKLRHTFAADGRPILALRGYGRTIADDSQPILIHPNSITSATIPEKIVKALGPEKIKRGLELGVIEATEDGGLRWSTVGYKNLEHPSFKGWKWGATAESGQPVLYESDLVAHPDYAEYLPTRLGLDYSKIRQNKVGRSLIKLSSNVKTDVFSLNFMHFTQIGFRSLFTGKNPFRTPAVDIEANPELYKLVTHHLQFHSPGDLFQELSEEGVAPSVRGIVSRIPGVRNVNHWLHEHLWSYVNSQKAQAALALLDRYKRAYPNKPSSEVYRMAAEDTNDRFGIQNWKALGVSKSWQDSLRLAILAPDWFTSEIRAMARLFSPTQGKIMQQDMVKWTAFMILASRAANLALTGDPHWEQPYGIVIPGQNGSDPTTLTIRSLPTDMFHFIQDARGAAVNRINPATVNTIYTLLTQRDRGGRRIFGDEVIEEAVKAWGPIWAQQIMERHDFSMDEKQKIVLAGLQTLGAEEYKSRSQAERLAMQYAYGDIGDRDPEKVKQRVVNLRVLDALRAGKITESQAYRYVPVKTARELYKQSQLTPLQSYFQRLSLNQKLNVWEVADKKEHQELRKEMQKSRRSWLVSHPRQRDRENQPEWEKMQEMFPDL